MALKINPVSITDSAIAEISNIIDKKKIPNNLSLRIGIKGGVGCSGVNYVVGFDKKTEHDQQFKFEKFDLLIDKRHFMFLMNVQLDFVEEMDQRGFKFINLASRDNQN